MATVRRMRFIRGHVAWMLGAVLVLVLVDAFSYELFFVLALIGFLFILQLTAPVNVRPTWRSRLKWPTIGALIVFGAIVVRRVLERLPMGVFGV